MTRVITMMKNFLLPILVHSRTLFISPPVNNYDECPSACASVNSSTLACPLLKGNISSTITNNETTTHYYSDEFEAEQRQISKLCSDFNSMHHDGENIMCGVERKDIDGLLYIGLKENGAGDYEWGDDRCPCENFENRLNWAPLEPNNGGSGNSNELCTVVRSDSPTSRNAFWNDVTCDFKGRCLCDFDVKVITDEEKIERMKISELSTKDSLRGEDSVEPKCTFRGGDAQNEPAVLAPGYKSSDEYTGPTHEDSVSNVTVTVPVFLVLMFLMFSMGIFTGIQCATSDRCAEIMIKMGCWSPTGYSSNGAFGGGHSFDQRNSGKASGNFSNYEMTLGRSDNNVSGSMRGIYPGQASNRPSYENFRGNQMQQGVVGRPTI